MNIDSSYPSKYLAAASDFNDDDDLIVTIKDVTIENVGQGEDAEDKPIIYFNEVKKGLLCNKTNKNTIKALYGAETDNWIGKKITLYPTEVEYGGKTVMGIRVRVKAPKAANSVAAAAGLLTLEQAKIAAASVGIDFDTFKTELRKHKGLADGEVMKWAPATDTDWVNALVDANSPQPDLEGEAL